MLKRSWRFLFALALLSIFPFAAQAQTQMSDDVRVALLTGLAGLDSQDHHGRSLPLHPFPRSPTADDVAAIIAKAPGFSTVAAGFASPAEFLRLHWELTQAEVNLPGLPGLSEALDPQQIMAELSHKRRQPREPAAEALNMAFSSNGSQLTAHIRGAAATYSVVLVSFYDTDLHPLGNQVQAAFGRWPLAELTVPEPEPGRAVIAHTYAIALERHGSPADITEGWALLGGGFPREVRNDAPILKPGSPHPYMVLCFNRAMGDSHDCSYGPYPHVPNAQVIFPVRGQITYRDPIMIDPKGRPANATVSITVANIDNGHVCPAGGMSQQEFLNRSHVSADRKTLSWDLGDQTFGMACYGSNTGLAYRFALTIATSQGRVWTTISNDSTIKDTAISLALPPMLIQYGCVVEGTQVAMADGSSKAIEAVAVGDRVASGDGRVLAVRDISRGTENNALYELSAGDGAKVVLTGTHPVKTGRGVIPAAQVREGDSVATRDGLKSVTIRIIDAIPAKTPGQPPGQPPGRKVRNLYLGPVDASEPGLDDRTFVAGGLLVGDATSQGRIEKAALRDDAALRARAAQAGWPQDYDAWTSGQAVRASAPPH